MTTPEELSDFLNLALQALQRLLKKKQFSSADDFEVAKQKNMIKINPLEVFGSILELTENEEDIVTNKQMYSRYKSWCKGKGLKPVGKVTLTKKLKELFDVEDRKFRAGVHWTNVKLVSLDVEDHILNVFANYEKEAMEITKEIIFEILGQQFSQQVIRKAVDQLENDGKIYSPRPGYLKRIYYYTSLHLLPRPKRHLWLDQRLH